MMSWNILGLLWFVLTLTTSTPLKNVDLEGNNLGECEGDCDSDDDCMGDLECWHRFETAEPNPPGCQGFPQDVWDYCYNPIVNNWLTDVDVSGENLGECEGDCDTDNDCIGDLKCFQRGTGAINPPGCQGIAQEKWDYCYNAANEYAWLTDVDVSGENLGECEGDCDSDNDCIGDLKCFQRGTGAVIPPGCRGITQDLWDYCYDPSNGWLTTIHVSGNNLGECQGDCDSDSDCIGDLKCFQRQTGDPNAPGCKGIAQEDWDYCYSPSNGYTLLTDVDVSGENLGECEGDCDSDNDCIGDLKCFQRGTGAPNPPGCQGIAQELWDYCYDPSNGWLINVHEAGNNLGECEGHCDSDDDCMGDLKCFQRELGDPNAPGCQGVSKNSWNYCINERNQVEDAFSILFISDMESEYRRHSIEMCDDVINWVKNIAGEGFKFDGAFNTFPIRPDLVIHGGDISDSEDGTWKSKGLFEEVWRSDASDYLFEEVWQQLYDAGIPMISAVGNHDVLVDAGDISAGINSNQQANQFVLQSYQKSKEILGDNFDFDEFKITNTLPSLFKSVFNGLQIVNINYYVDQFDSFSKALDYGKKTIFFGHVPIETRAGNTDELKALISKFDKTAYLSGHLHKQMISEHCYDPFENRWLTNECEGEGDSFKDYVAAYPHPWEKSDISGEYYDAGMYAILVSPTSGVLQVKNIVIPYEQVTGCWEDGAICGAGTTGTCNEYCCHKARNALGTQCGGAAWDNGTLCGVGSTCQHCFHPYEYWYSKAFTACGSEPKWSDGTICAEGTTCNACENPSTYWWSESFTACGSEPCWVAGTTCGLGTTCHSCCTGNGPAYCPVYWFGFCECV